MWAVCEVRAPPPTPPCSVNVTCAVTMHCSRCGVRAVLASIKNKCECLQNTECERFVSNGRRCQRTRSGCPHINVQLV